MPQLKHPQAEQTFLSSKPLFTSYCVHMCVDFWIQIDGGFNSFSPINDISNTSRILFQIVWAFLLKKWYRPVWSHLSFCSLPGFAITVLLIFACFLGVLFLVKSPIWEHTGGGFLWIYIYFSFIYNLFYGQKVNFYLRTFVGM